MTKYLGFFVLILSIWIVFFKDNTVDYGSGVLAPNEPIQNKLASAKSFIFKDYIFIPLATFEINAKVLSKENYSHGRESELSPLDLALGWGKMSNKDVTQGLDISQSGRWYRWSTDKLPIPKREIETHSANMHLIPMTEDLKDRAMSIREGDIVSIKGKLVSISAKDGWRWKSSLSRTDIGKGACELIFVEELFIEELPLP